MKGSKRSTVAARRRKLACVYHTE